MRRDNFGFQQTLLLDIRHHRHALFVAHIFHFQGSFGNMGMQGNIELDCQLGSGAQDFRGAGIRGMRGNGWHDQGMAFPVLDEFAGHRQRFFVETGIRGWKFQDGLRANRAHPGFGGGGGNAFFKIVHIGKCGDAAADHLSAGQACAKIHKIG